MRRLAIVTMLAVGACNGSQTAEKKPEPTPAPAPEPTPEPPPAPALDLAKTAFATEGCFMLRDLATGAEVVSDATRCAKARRPYSTFKIPNALIGVELGILDGPDAPMKYDPKKRPPKDWWIEEWKHDQTLRSAIQISAVPVFQDLALAIGRERMQAHLDKLGYGNKTIGDASMLDHFWLDGPIRITPREQIDFVAKLAKQELPVSAKSQQVLREVLLREERGDWKLFYKTGSGAVEDDDQRYLGWLVGWIERGASRQAFAFWIESPGDDIGALRDRRNQVAETIWHELGIPPKT